MNKISLYSFILLLGSTANTLQAQQPDDSQNIMQQMAAMESCMAKIDYRELEEMERRSGEIHQQLNQFCTQGNETEAKKLALEFSDEVMKSKTMQAMQDCASLIPGMQQQLQIPDFEQQLKQQSICEFINQ